jgi:hypothetical protein
MMKAMASTPNTKSTISIRSNPRAGDGSRLGMARRVYRAAEFFRRPPTAATRLHCEIHFFDALALRQGAQRSAEIATVTAFRVRGGGLAVIHEAPAKGLMCA